MVVGVKDHEIIFIEAMVVILDLVRIIPLRHLVDPKLLFQADSKGVVKITYQDLDNTILILNYVNLVLPSSIALVDDQILQQELVLQDREHTM